MPKTVPAAGEAMPKSDSTAYFAAWQKCRDLGKHLSQALLETGDNEFAFIQPADKQCAVTFGALNAETKNPLKMSVHDVVDANRRLSELMNEMSQIILGYPELKIDCVKINEHGAHLFHKIPGFASIEIEQEAR